MRVMRHAQLMTKAVKEPHALNAYWRTHMHIRWTLPYQKADVISYAGIQSIARHGITYHVIAYHGIHFQVESKKYKKPNFVVVWRTTSKTDLDLEGDFATLTVHATLRA